MKNWICLVMAFLVVFSWSCGDDDEVSIESFPVNFNFSSEANGLQLELNELQYENEAGNTFSVEKLQYLISDVSLTREDGSTVDLEGYHFVDVTDPSTTVYDKGFTVEEGDYTGISFVFGFRDEDNITGAYTDLNALSWSWPEMLGGGYHFMKLEGRYVDTNTNTATYATHMGNAREITASGNVIHSNFVEVNLEQSFTINGPATIGIIMEISNWYSNPHTWDLNLLNNTIMPNYEAQIMLNDNGHNVFSVEAIIQ